MLVIAAFAETSWKNNSRKLSVLNAQRKLSTQGESPTIAATVAEA
jgi:hypothetical protein